VTVLVSNRGPYRFVASEGGFDPHPGPGGLANALRPFVSSGDGGDITWIAAAHDDGDRAAVRAHAVEPACRAVGIELQLLALDPDLYRLANDLVANQTLWFLHHGLFDLVRHPRFDARFREAWDAFVVVSTRFADAVAETAPEADIVLVQDYQLALVPGMLRARRPDLRIAHFTHTPFCGPNSIRVLPTDAAGDLCRSMASVPTGFHSQRWGRAYQASALEMLGDAEVTPSFTAPLGPDADALARALTTPESREARAELDELVGDRSLVVRVDRIDPSKNIVRGFAAFDLLLSEHPQWRERVVFLAALNASRETLTEYLAYRQEVEAAANQVNERWATAGWQPVVLETRDDYARSLSALARYDVLVVNPIKDGLNLVAKEGPLLNERDGVLCLSPDAGAWDELGNAAVAMHPFDLEQAAAALDTALSMSADERGPRSARLRELARARTPRAWFDDQLTAAR
jgi:trehalose 6-phosphate synthase